MNERPHSRPSRTSSWRSRGVTAINGVSFTVGRRELFAIIGPNGAGKTSIFNVLSGVYRPQAGRVVFDGADIVGRRPHRIAAAGMARTFQNVELFANLTVLDNLMLGRHTPPAATAPSPRSPGSAGRGGRSSPPGPRLRPSSTSSISSSGGGCRSGCAVRRAEAGRAGRALAMRPKLLLLDEPVPGMNLEETEDMARYILDIRDELQHPDASWSSTTWAWSWTWPTG